MSNAPPASAPSIDQDDRASLEAAHSVFLDRLHRRSDDFDATRELRLVTAALHRLTEQEASQ
jgi:hypothetical protein